MAAGCGADSNNSADGAAFSGLDLGQTEEGNATPDVPVDAFHLPDSIASEGRPLADADAASASGIDMPGPTDGPIADAWDFELAPCDGGSEADGGAPSCPALVLPAPLVPDSNTPAQICGQFDGSAVAEAAYSEKTHTVVLGTAAGAVRFYRATDGAPGPTFSAGVCLSSLALSPDGQTLATWSESASGNAEVKLWRVSDLAVQKIISTDTTGRLFFSKDGSVLVGSWSGKLQMWRAIDGAPASEPFSLPDYSYGVALSPDGATLAVGRSDFRGEVTVWRLSDRQQLANFQPEMVVLRNTAVLALEFSPNGQRLAVQTHYGTSVWKTSDWSLAFPELGTTGAENLAFSPDGTVLSTAGSGNLSLWNSATGANLASVACSASQVAFAADGKSLTAYGAETNVVAVPSGAKISSW